MNNQPDNRLYLKNRHTGETLLLARVRDDNGQVVLNIEGTLPAGADGPPLHIHWDTREEGVVKSGTLGAKIGTETVRIPAGGNAVFPAGVPHRWWNAGDELLQFNGRVVPAGDLDSYLQAIFAVLNASDSGRPSLFYLAHVASRHRQTQQFAAPPPLVQKLLFPLVLLVGRLLGKYRGAEWPGAPESCQGAPSLDIANR